MLELMPDGETFKKLTKAQHNALDRYYKREKDTLLDKTLPPLLSTGLPTIIAIGLGAAAYVFKDRLEDEINEAGQNVIDFVGSGLFKFTGLGQVTSLLGPFSQEYIVLADGTKVQLTKCERWENDLVNIVDSGATALLPIYIAAMKKDGCSKPAFVSDDNWKKV